MNQLFADRIWMPVCLLILISAAIPVGILTAQPAAEGTADSGGVRLNGFVSTSYSHNFNKPTSRLNRFRIFDFDDGMFKPDVAELVLQKLAERPGQAGFRVDLELGSSIPRVTAARGLFRNSAGEAGDIDLQQAYISYVLPVGQGLRIDAGKFVTWAGYEYIDGYDGYNDHATHSFLFGYAVPSTHTGLRLNYAASPQFSAVLMATNGWDVVVDNNRSLSLGTQLLLSPFDGVSVGVGYVVGPERDGNDSNLRHLIDVYGTWKVGDRLLIGLNGDYGAEQGAVRAGRYAVWQGLAAYLKLTIGDRFGLGVRGEYFDDLDGARTGVSQILKEITLTPEFRPAANILFRADFRMDFSTGNVFDKEGGLVKTQPTVLVNGIYLF